VRGEVGLTWLQDQRHDNFTEADVQVNSISTQIHPPPQFEGPPEFEPISTSKDVSSPLASPPAGDLQRPDCNCELCKFESQAASGGCCNKHVGTEHDLEHAEEEWQLSPLGVAWVQPSGGASLETTAALDGDLPSKHDSGTSGTFSPGTTKAS